MLILRLFSLSVKCWMQASKLTLHHIWSFFVSSLTHTMQGDTMSCGRIHVQQSFREFARALKKFRLVESDFCVQWQQIHRRHPKHLGGDSNECPQHKMDQRPMGNNAHLNVQLWRLYSAKNTDNVKCKKKIAFCLPWQLIKFSSLN